MLPRFWRKIRYRYRLVGSYCESCGKYFYPPRNLCPKCRRKGSIKEVPLGNEGVIISYTVVHDAPEDFRLQKPYIVGLVKLDCGAVVTAQICCKPEEIEIGKRVKAVFRKYSEEGEDGIIYYGTKFEPI